MFPTCSNRFFAGRNALSTADLTISHPEDAWAPPTAEEYSMRGLPLNRQPGAVRAFRWYVGRALGERGRHPRLLRVRRGRTLIAAMASLLVATSAAACGGDEERQDENEPAADFPVEVTSAKFPTRQRLAETSDLVLEVENIGDETIPDLAITIYTGDEGADGPFNIRSEQEGLADPNRPVWILENGYPKVLDESVDLAELDDEPTAGAETAATNTYAFGPLAPGESVTGVWRVTPVQGGTYTVHYEVAGGLDGKAKAVAADGSPVENEFVATISTKPPNTRVTDSGEVEVVQ
jgi:hypothetical protein